MARGDLTEPLVAVLERLADRWTGRRLPARRRPDATGHSRCAVVTGASQGIGRAFAIELARHGCDLFLVARRPAPLASVADEIGSRYAVSVTTLPLDLTDADAGSVLADRLAAAGIEPYLLVNNAAIGLGGPMHEQPIADLERLIRLNIGVTTTLMRLLLPGMLARGRGGIINIGSLGGAVPGPHQAAYYASKSYLQSLTEAVGAEVAGLGVRVAIVLPGPVATEFHATMGAEHSYYLRLLGVMEPDQIARAGWRGFRLGRVLIYPGFPTQLHGLALRLIPHMVSVPIIGWMLRRRD